jgi:hypothetical protein
LTYFLTIFSFCQAQKQQTLYYGVSSDSLHSGHQLEFKNDTSLEISTFPRHMSRQFTMTFQYKKSGKTIEIFNPKISQQDSLALTNNGFKQFLDKVVFTVDGKAIIDKSNRLIYVIYGDFEKKYYLTYLIDNKIYKQETGLSDAYGLIKNNPKGNKVLKDKLASLKDDLKNYDIKVYKGLEAYNKLGYKSVFGVIELKRRQ